MAGLNGSALLAEPSRRVRRFRRRVGHPEQIEPFDEAPAAVVDFSEPTRALLDRLVRTQSELADAHQSLAKMFREEREERRRVEEERRRAEEKRETELLELKASAKVSREEIEALKTDEVRMQAVSSVILLFGAGIGTVATIVATMLIQWVSKQFLH